MNTETYTKLLANPSSIKKEDLQGLAAVIENYPYFQSARALQLKGLKNDNSFLYNDALKVTAAYTTDRDILFEYITSETFIQNEISERIVQQSEAVREMPVIAEDVSEQVSMEIDRQLKAEIKKAEAILDPDLFEKKVSSVIDLAQGDEAKSPSEEIPAETQPGMETAKDSGVKIETDAPLAFTEKDTHTFSEWLKLTRATPIVRKEAPKTSPDPTKEKKRKFELIEKFIQDRPKMDPQEMPSQKKNLAKPYTKASDTLMTETLAKVYLQQKNYKKAIQAYKILILKNPEKSGFFADQIRAIQKLIKEA